MIFIGAYTKNSTILLELLTKDEHNALIPADFAPSASLEYFDGNGLTRVLNVTLETIDPGRYIKAISVADDWKYGDYLVTYEANLERKIYTTKERFQVRQNDVASDGGSRTSIVLVSDLTILTASGGFTTLMMNGLAVQGATVNIYESVSGNLAAKATTDFGGHWNAQVYPGQYKFEFVHPSGTILRTIDKAVR